MGADHRSQCENSRAQEPPGVTEGTWIKVGGGPEDSGQDGYVLRKVSDTLLEVGIYQERLKAIGEIVFWTGKRWNFKFPGPCGRYLQGPEEVIVKAGPRGLS